MSIKDQERTGDEEMETGVILLAGGKSSRMGTNKALLPVGKTTNIERIIKAVSSFSEEIWIVTNDPHDYEWLGLPMVADEYPGKGPLAGLQAGLKATSRYRNVVVACDMPFVSATIALSLLEQSAGYEAAVPRIQNKLHPLFAVYTKDCLPVLEQCLLDNRLRVLDLLEQVRVHYVQEKDLPAVEDMHKVFFNMNRPHEYEQVKTWIQ